MKRWKQTWGIVCSMGLILSGCSSSGEIETVSETAQNNEAEASSAEKQESSSVTASELLETGTGTEASKKEEMIYALADAEGSVYETTVETTLISDSDDPVLDISRLSDIKNTQGGEEFFTQEDGTILWENLGNDIQYEGSSEEGLPVNVSFSFQLDGKEISPEELAGKSGHVVIRVDYENTETLTVSVDGEKVKTIVPFTAITAVMLDEDVFDNVEVTNGDMVSVSGVQMAVGYAMPGVEDALDLDNLDLDVLEDLSDDSSASETNTKSRDHDADEEFNIPDCIEIEADVTDFSLEFTETIVTPGLLSDLPDDTLKNLNSSLEGMADLGEASEEILDGFSELDEGVGTISAEFGTFNDGISELNDGAAALQSGMSQILSAGSELESGAAGIADALKSLESALSSAGSSGSVDLSGLEGIQTALSAAAADIGNLMTAASQMQSAYASLQEYGAELQVYQASLEASADAAASAQESLNSIDTSELSEEVQAAVENAKSSIGQVQIGSLPAFPEISVDTELLTGAAEDLALQVQTLTASAENLTSALSGLGGISSQLAELQSGIRTISGYAAQLNSGVKAYDEALNTLYQEGIVSLSKGTSALAEAGDAFESALQELSDAVKEFKDGYEEFDEEGIRKLADAGNSDASLLLSRIRALKKADASYDNFAGKFEGQDSSVTFLIETDTIE